MNKKPDTAPKILIGFDFGMKRIGVAIGQTITQTARPLDTIQSKEGEPNWDAITHLIKKWLPDALVVGIPLNMDGTDQAITHHARAFANKLHDRFKLPVYEMDERLTTKDARERLFIQGGYKALQGGQVDRVAAQLILQNWFAEKLK
ncbi:Holliday junction resolvase RuvX [Aquicella lusitana]|uniref:Putative pre-16S rRNA nuclease n=1 Tax=Aquicella lusitana TaxID=254246 RepID=A0A370GTF7_9COXI|nr:Holliday junction resolvase RuvX [Aquicella lusitana]RDI46546.1 putative Holliday junction resolvase [Aquicella lusitana]VVC74210.1 Putative Holliday junction resolvase [Aquicella lusitana]